MTASRACARAILLSALLAALLTPASRGADADDLVAPAAFVPADVTLYLHVEDARAIARDLGPRPIGRLFKDRLGSGDLELAWDRLAEQAGRDRQQLFDEWLGERMTFVVRPGAGGHDWAIITVVDEARAVDAIQRLRPRRLAPRSSLPVVELPEHGLLVARAGARFVIGPTRPAILFNQVVALVSDDGASREPTLAGHAALLRARTLGAGQAAFFVRHGAALGGWSVAIADLRAGELRLRHAARFAHPLFERPVPTKAFDVAALDAIEKAALMAVIEPTEIGPTGFEAFAESRLGAPLLSPDMRRAMGDVRIFTIGEVEGRQADPPADQLLPAAAIAIKLDDPAGAERALDAHLLRLARAFDGVAGPGAQLTMPAADAFAPGRPRSIDLEPVMSRVGPNLPLLRSVTLNWTVASGACGSFWVVATHPEHLDQTVAAIESADAPRRVGCWASCGTMNGPRLGLHLRSYRDQADALAAPGAENVDAFRETLLILSEMAGGVDRCRWNLARPAPREMDLDVEATLRAPESAERGQSERD